MANYTILLIDYEPRSIERFRDPLVAAGYTVEIATDGVSGIEAFHRLSPDMVLVEAMIPKKHGFEVCQELKRTPHGRRTPVLITTGVYKGRKYRTQALHIYGCDEYIEKPIAPEQLLEIVGKFFGSGALGPATRATEPAPVTLESDSSSNAHDTDSAIAETAASAETPAPEIQRTKPNSIPQAIAKDDSEDEIMARLDAILPTGGSANPLFAMPATVAVVAAVEQDPFAQMRAELDAELGSFSGALALEPEFIPSDQAVSPSVLEALPVPEAEIPVVPLPPPTPVIADERPGQVVNFDNKRPRKNNKNKKAERPDKGPSPQVALAPPDPVPPAPEPIVPRAIAPPVPVPVPVSVAEVTLPPGTLVEAELESAAGRRGMPAWAGVAAGLVAIAALYVVFSRGVSNERDAGPLPAPPTDAVAITPSEASAPSEAPPQVPAPSKTVADSTKLALNTLKVPVPKKTSERASVPPPPIAPPANSEPVKSEPTRSEPAEIETAKVTPPESPAPSELDANVAGVEAVPDPAAAAPVKTIAPGALIPIDEADTMPVSLSHHPPVYSTLAKQMRVSGTVVMNVLVNDRGTVDQVVLVSGVTGADLNDAAMLAAKSWTYRPATKNGVPVKVWKSEQVVFKL